MVGGESLGHEVAEQLERLAPFGMGNPGVRLLVPSARVCEVRPMGEGDKHARFRLRSGSRNALGVAFGVNGGLEAPELADPLDVSLKLELNEWNGAVEPRVVLGELYPEGPRCGGRRAAVSRRSGMVASAGRRAADAARGLAAARERSTAPPRLIAARSSIGAAARGWRRWRPWLSSGESVLALCADALRRRELVERAAAPARFGGGRVAIASGRLADDAVRAAIADLGEAGCGVLLADWAALARVPSMAAGFEHLVVIDPPPFPHLEQLAPRESAAAGRGPGFLHLAWGEAEVELALRVHEEEWPLRPALVALYRALRDPGRPLRDALQGPGRHPCSPEVAGRRLRVLEEADAVRWQPSGTAPALSVVSSEAKDLELLGAFVAYRDRYEEGRRFLSRQRQPS